MILCQATSGTWYILTKIMCMYKNLAADKGRQTPCDCLATDVILQLEQGSQNCGYSFYPQPNPKSLICRACKELSCLNACQIGAALQYLDTIETTWESGRRGDIQAACTLGNYNLVKYYITSFIIFIVQGCNGHFNPRYCNHTTL